MGGLNLFKVVKRVLQLQLLAILLASAVAGFLGGSVHAVSAAVGGVVAMMPNLLFALVSGRRNPAKTANQVLGSFYLGEVLKLSFTVFLFVIVFQLPNILPLSLFAAYFAVVAVVWFAPLLGTQ